jgi:hypothetical protein
MGHPFGPVCAKLMGVAPERKTASKTVRDEKTQDLFQQDQPTDTKQEAQWIESKSNS